jgi:hypothetical protein
MRMPLGGVAPQSAAHVPAAQRCIAQGEQGEQPLEVGGETHNLVVNLEGKSTQQGQATSLGDPHPLTIHRSSLLSSKKPKQKQAPR